MKSINYHSAIMKEDWNAEPLQRHDWPNGSCAIQHDIFKASLPIEFERCDVFYCEPPWRAGVKVFNERAGAEQTSFDDLMKAFSRAIKSLTKPAVIITSKTHVRSFPQTEKIIPTLIEHHKSKAVALLYNWQEKIEIDFSTNNLIMNGLASLFNCVGDFCCGYGATARAFHAKGKRFVASDFNSRCIGHMAKNI